MTAGSEHAWWQRGVIYQIYPRSFQDTDGDGVGDLRGITRRLDHLAWLGVDALWISPFFPSPMKDFGYDISSYTDIDPLFGTMADFDELLEQAHARGLRVILDLVPNHTSDRHPWFVESRASRQSDKRDWYIWRDPAEDGGPPNNWLSEFGGPAWELDEDTGQYYYHAFLEEQPDLNWRNPEVQDAMIAVMRFWLEKGVDGFRVDVMWHLMKDAQFRDNPKNPDWTPDQSPYRRLIPAYSTDQPDVHAIVALMRRTLDRYGERVLIGEIYLPITELVRYYGEHGSGAHLPFNFQLVVLPWDAGAIAAAVTEYEASLPSYGWPNWVLGNHDKPRVASRVGHAQARVAAMLLLTLRGTPTLYYGDEIGMADVEIPPGDVRDPVEARMPGLGLSRDPQRTPMQWDATPCAGFTTGRPWLPLGPDAQRVNVETQAEDPHSMLTLHRRLLALRRSARALAVGDYAPVDAEPPVFAFRRSHERDAWITALNFGSAPATLELPGGRRGRIALSTHLDREGERVDDTLALRADEGVLVKMR
jgi:alpha-glucosidase